MSVIDEIVSERRRQVTTEGYDTKHDDAHRDGAIAKAAAAYAAASVKAATGAMLWPWSIDKFKPKHGRDSLIKAAALIIAEIERRDRAEAALTAEQGRHE